jgi:Rieske Fe-S protein
MKLQDSYLTRRRLLCNMLGGGAVTLGAGLTVPLVQYAGNFQEEPLPDFLKLAKDDYDVAPGQSRIVKYGSLPVLVMRASEQAELRVFVAVCTHFDCTVSYQADHQRIFCACHEGCYDLDGNVTSGPPPAPLRKMHFQLQGDTLILALEKENLEKASATTQA